MRTFLFFVAVVSCWLAMPQAVSACTCQPAPAPLEELERAAVVFTGTVIEIDEEPLVIEQGGDKVEIPLFLFTKFKVDQSWKGVDGDETIILTYEGGCSYCCFQPGEDYLVYGYIEALPFTSDELPFSSVEGEAFLQSSACSRTRLLTEATEDIEALDGATAVTPSLWGQIKAWFMVT